MKTCLYRISVAIALVGLVGFISTTSTVKKVIPFSVFTKHPVITGLQAEMSPEEAVEAVRDTCATLRIGKAIRVTSTRLTWEKEDFITISKDAASNTKIFFSYKKTIRFADVGTIKLTEIHSGQEGPVFAWWIEVVQIGVPKTRTISREGYEKTVKQNPELFAIMGGKQKREVLEIKNPKTGYVLMSLVSFPTEEARGIKDRFLAALLVLCPNIKKDQLVEIAEF